MDGHLQATDVMRDTPHTHALPVAVTCILLLASLNIFVSSCVIIIMFGDDERF